MQSDEAWMDRLRRDLPRHAAIIDGLAAGVEADDRWRFLSVGCSLGRGNGDEHSDIDAGIGLAEPLPVDELERDAARLVADVAELVDSLVHHWRGFAETDRRVAAEYRNGVQLDLVFFQASRRTGRLPDEEFAVVDKDGTLARPGNVAALAERLPGQCREWTFLGWWAVSDVAKYLRRGSLFEAAARLDFIREQALRLFAAAQGIRFPEFGLTSLLDYPPFELPDGLADTFARPDDGAAVHRAAVAAANLLADCAARAGAALGLDLTTPMAITAWARLDASRALAPQGEPLAQRRAHRRERRHRQSG